MQIDPVGWLDMSTQSVSQSVTKIVSLSIQRSWTSRIQMALYRLAGSDEQRGLAYITEQSCESGDK